MKLLKYVLSFLILFVGLFIIGESHTFRLNNFYTPFISTSAYLAHNTTEEEMITDMLSAAERNEVEFFAYTRSTPNSMNTEYTIYGSSELQKYFEQELDIRPVQYKSMLLEDIQFKFKGFSSIEGLNKIHDFYIIGDLKKSEEFKAEIVDKYGGSIPREGYQDHISEYLILSVWLLMIFVILFISYYDSLSQKREIVLRWTMGESIRKLYWKNVLMDTAFITLFIILIFSLLASITSVFFGFKISVLMFGILIIGNAFMYINIFFFKLKESFANSKGDSKRLLSINYGLKLISVLLTIFIISANLVVIQESIKLYKQKPFFEEHKDYSYIRLNYRPEINSEGALVSRLDEGQALYKQFYENYFTSSKATILTDTDYLLYGNGIIANIHATDYLKEQIKELRNVNFNKDICIIVSDQYKNNVDVEETIQESLHHYFGEKGYSTETIFYKDNIEVLYTDVLDTYGSNYKHNPIILLNAIDVEKANSEHIRLGTDYMSNFHEDVLFKMDDQTYEAYVAEHGLEGEIVRKTNVLDKYMNSWEIAKRLLFINLIFSLLVISLELIIITTIIRLEFRVNAIELSLKKVLGYRMVSKNKLIILMTMITTILSVLSSIIVANLLNLNQVYYIALAGLLILIIEAIVISFYIRKIDGAQIPKILKGGNL